MRPAVAHDEVEIPFLRIRRINEGIRQLLHGLDLRLQVWIRDIEITGGAENVVILRLITRVFSDFGKVFRRFLGLACSAALT
ncbi:hypothetical protein D3C76_1648740 [compost metagenome]